MKKITRKNFLRTAALSVGAGLTSPLVSSSKSVEKEDTVDSIDDKNKSNKIAIFQTTDVHCQIHPHDELFWENGKAVFRKCGGYGQIASYFTKLRNDYTHSFFIDTGDMFQGSELSIKTTGKAYVPILDQLKYDLYLPGNWEVIYGKKQMQNLLGGLKAPKICANMYHDLGNNVKGELIFQPYYIWNVSGVKIGFLGYTDHLVPQRQSPIYSKGILYTKPEENLAYYVDVLKNQEQCDFILIIAHIGLSQQLALGNLPECEGVNYILGGDTHERVRKPIQCKYTKVVEPGAFGSFIGKLELEIKDGKIVNDIYELIEVKSDKVKPEPKMQALIDGVERDYRTSINKVVGYSTIPLYRYFVVENPIDTMILNALNWKFPDIDIVLSNGFRFCPPRSTPDHTGNIPITSGYIYDMLPVDSTVRTASITGKQLVEWLEKELNNVFAKNAQQRFGGWVVKFKGIKVEFNAFGEAGSRIKSITFKGNKIESDRMYSILACEREGDPDDMLCRIKNVKNPKNTSETLHKVMHAYLSHHKIVTPIPEKNAVILDAPQTLLTQVSGVEYVFS